jgi:hypothetical protein
VKRDARVMSSLSRYAPCRASVVTHPADVVDLGRPTLPALTALRNALPVRTVASAFTAIAGRQATAAKRMARTFSDPLESLSFHLRIRL